ncbi:MAG TPA: DUF3536 domain-containing protein, partial [bacterium]|nr:DUF3536 domain-containing protein [bacterium]
CGIDFTILAPNQARRVRRLGEQEWRDVSGGRIDPKRPYLCRLPSGSSINLFFYDGPISRDIAFGDLLDNGQGFAGRLLGAFTGNGDEDQLVHIATDGESYGHHRRFGDMALAYCLQALESNGSAQLTIYGEYLEKHPSSWEVEIFENSSWSCVHGIERWRSDCGCNSGGHPGWNQRWRRPLREAMDWLRDRLAELYEKEGAVHFRDPWRARDDYIRVILNRSDRSLESFFSTHGREGWHREKGRAALKLLEMERNAMLMFTSCGWFFDEISGLETVQIIQYAARAIQLARDAAGVDLEAEYRERLARASSNIPGYKDGAWIYDNFVKPAVVDLHRVGAHYAVTSLFEEYPEKKRIYEYQIKSEQYDRREAGKQKCAVGRILVTSLVTREAVLLDFASLYLGNHNLVAAVRNHDGAEESSLAGIMEAFQGNNIPEVIREIDRHFEKHNYTLWHLFRDEQRQVLDHVIHGTREELEASFRHLYRHHYPVIQVLKKAEVPLPREMAALEEFVLNADFRASLETARINTRKLQSLVDELKGRPQQIDRQLVEFVVRSRVERMMEEIIAAPDDLSGIRRLSRVLKTIEQLPVRFDFWKAQNLFFQLAQGQVQGRRARAKGGDEEAVRWLRTFARLGEQLRVGLPGEA